MSSATVARSGSVSSARPASNGVAPRGQARQRQARQVVTCPARSANEVVLGVQVVDDEDLEAPTAEELSGQAAERVNAGKARAVCQCWLTSKQATS